ncbi:MAG TPA: PQQ-binding-like beta-propeller repeat protein [Sphingobacteriaceae bacterium]
MKKFMLLLGLFVCLFWHHAVSQPFKFAFITDTHIGSDTAEEDLRRTISDINMQTGIDFVLLTGDITEMGTDDEIRLARRVIGELKIPFYIIPGNHDTGWSESGGVSFIREFGYDKFVFDHKGYRFIGCASGPYVRMSDGHIPRDAVVWLDSVLAKTPKDQPIVFANHYPLDPGLDNWFEVTDRLKKYNTQLAICGHGHNNRAVKAEGIPAVMGRSNLRAKAGVGGYNIVEMRGDSVFFHVKTPGKDEFKTWRRLPLQRQQYNDEANFERPSFAVNVQFPAVKPVWTYHSNANVVSTPAYTKGLAIFGNSVGEVEALSIKDGKKVWSYRTDGAIYSSPAVIGNRVVLGSGDGHIYSLNAATGELLWKLKAGASVLGTPAVDKGIVYIGGSDGQFRAIESRTGRQLWVFSRLEGTVVSKPLIYQGKVIFGAWDRHLYALDQNTGELIWKWNNGHSNRMFSPAMVNALAADGVVYIAAPDRYLTAIDAETGKALWRTKEATVRESIGISADKKLIYGKTMNDEIVAFKTGSEKADLAWRLNAGYGYEHVPSMLIEKKGRVYFGTKNGTVYAIDPVTKQVVWAHKLDNSMVNTVNVIRPGKVLTATMDGVVALIKAL